MRIAINGFGRIGRSFLRSIFYDNNARKKLDVVAINIGPARIDQIAHLFKYDTIMRVYPGNVDMDGDYLIIDDHKIRILAECDPRQIKWDTLDIDWLVESSGHFTSREKAMLHIKSGAKSVLITAPSKGEDITIIPGVNDHQFDSQMHHIVSLGSCTTNALLPLLAVLHRTFKIKQGMMSTIHAYTNSQVLLDVNDNDLRRSRAAALNIIPTTTGAVKVVGKIIPELDGCITGLAMRIPLANVSLLDLAVITEETLTLEHVHEAFQEMVKKQTLNIIAMSTEPLVSSDFMGNDYSVVIDTLLTDVHGKSGKLFGWYDNEWGYSQRLKDFLVAVV